MFGIEEMFQIDPAYSALAILDFRFRKESNLKMHFLLISTPYIVSVNRHLLYTQEIQQKKIINQSFIKPLFPKNVFKEIFIKDEIEEILEEYF